MRRSLAELGELTLLFAAALRGSFRRPFYWQELLEQCRVVLVANLVPLLLTGLGFGAIVSLEAGQFFRAASAEYRLGGFSVMANIREFSPVATGLMIAAVSGTAIVADLGARQIRSELEALSVMGLSNVLFVVVPRALALMLMTALYNFPMICFTTLASFFVGVFLVGVNPGGFVASFWTQGTVVDVIGGEIKCVVFGAIVAAICIFKGVSARGGAEGVARAVHSSVVWSFLAVSVFEYLFTPTMLALFHEQITLR
ncbi:MAG TPA: ABC transporter permease [Candidatus Dormibacteraeota bacterium]|nr:ABC transporter permease [Candidatus Dormibacteraeota bacterium]